MSTGSQAQDLSFNDSPTIRVDGKDVELGSGTGLSSPLKSERNSVCGSTSACRFRSEMRGVKFLIKVAERATPVAAVIAALSTLACCLPIAFLGGWRSRERASDCSQYVLGCSPVRPSCSEWGSFSRTSSAINAKNEPVEHCTRLGRRCNRSPYYHYPFPAADSQLDCGLRHANAKGQIRVVDLRDGCCVLNDLVSLAVEKNAARSTRAHVIGKP